MTFASPLGGIQQAGAPETAAKSFSPCFYFRLVITSAYIQVCLYNGIPMVEVADAIVPILTPIC